MPRRTVLTVCSTCRPDGADPAAEPAGAALGRATLAALEAMDCGALVEARAIACLSACSRSCTATVASAGKFSYVIGNLAPADAGDLATFARRHAESADGVPAWRSRPETIRKNTIARVPPPDERHPLVDEIKR